MKLKIWEIALICVIAVSILGTMAINSSAEDLSGKLIRLHVVANSDTDEDQSLKLKVRDKILSQLSASLYGVTSREEAEKIISVELNEIERWAESVVTENGYGYSVSATLCEEDFPTTEYETFSLPAGRYLSLRVKIGEAAGHNWWCVVFPPVCTSSSIDEMTTAAVGLTDDEIGLITEADGGYEIKFKFMEFLGKIKEILK